MPGDNRLGLDQEEGVWPGRPQTTEKEPEKPVGVSELGPGLFPFEDGQLLTEGGDLQGERVPGENESAKVGEHRDEE